MEQIQRRDITAELTESYLDYAMSVIVSRALPDARDGLKPVQRRILYAMNEMGLRAGARFRKSATVIGQVLGAYHPHGDIPVYDALVRMAQDFSLRYLLVTGQGNFGSRDNDPAAHYRYTEAKLSRIAEEMLADIEKDTVDFRDNFDATKKEPTVLPSKIPNLLLNGTVGIAVGMATNIPPHNLNEVMDALLHLADHPGAATEDLLQFIQGPDFPTAGVIFDKKAILEAYGTGRGPILTRGVVDVAENGKGGDEIVITEIPYQVSKTTLIEKIAELVRDKKIEGVRDLRDESDKQGMRVVLYLKNDAVPQKIVNALYKYTELERSFHVNLLALRDGVQPEVLPLKSLLEQFLDHRKIVVERRTRFDLARAQERAHILEGLVRALDRIDAVIKTIRQSKDRETAKVNLVKRFDLSDAQAQAILDMRLAALANLEAQKIKDELKEKQVLIAELTALLKDPKKMLAVIKSEFKEIKEKYGDERRTKVRPGSPKEIGIEDIIPEEEAVVVLTKGAYVKRMNPELYRSQQRGGKGIIGVTPKEEDIVEHFVTANTHANLLFFTDAGKCYQAKVYEIPEGTRQSRGKALAGFLQVGQNERVTALLDYLPEANGKKVTESPAAPQYLVMATKHGIIKKTPLEDFANVRKNGLIALSLKKNDVLGWAKGSGGKDEVMLITKQGQSIRFAEKDVRPMGRTAAGVTGVDLGTADEVVGMTVISAKPGDLNILVVTENGYGKKTALKSYRKQRRAGKGIKTAKITAKTGAIVAARLLDPSEEDLIAISRRGQVIRVPLSSISRLGRQTQGVRIMRLESEDAVASVTCV